MMSRTKDGSDYDYGPYEDEYRGFDRAGDEGGRGPVILFLALGVLVIFAGVIWNTYRQGIRPSGAALPVVAGPVEPYKRVTDAGGGEPVPGTEKSYYALMDGESGKLPVEDAAIRDRAAIRRRSDQLAGAPDPLPPVPETDAPAPVSQSEVVRLADETVERLDPREPADTDDIEVKTAALDQSPLKLTPPVERAAALPSPQGGEPAVVEQIVASRFSDQGGFQVQLAALRSDEAAREAWAKAKSRNPALFSGARLDIQRADLGARGVFYRLRLGRFETRDLAKAFCDEVEATGGDCMVVAGG